MAASNNSSTHLRGGSSTVIQGGSISKRWNLEELKACGAIGTGISRELTLTGTIHPVFAKWTENLDPRLSRELKQPLLLATKLLDGTGLPWISDFIIDDIFDESYPGRHSLGSGSRSPPASSSSSSTTPVQKYRPGLTKEKPHTNWHRLSRTTISNALKFSHEDESAPDTTPPLSPCASWSASSSYMSPRSSVTSSAHSTADSLSTATSSAASSNPHSRVTSLTLPEFAPQQQSRGGSASIRHPAGHQKSASTSALGRSVGELSAPLPAAGPETVFRHRRAPWWTRGLETKWLHRTDRWLRRELGPGLMWRLDTSGSGHICNNFLSNHGTPSATTRRSGSECYKVWISSEFPERLAALRESGQLASEEYISSAFMTCVAILHELGHAVYWQGFQAQSYDQQQFPSLSSREPYYGADLEMELGDSFVSSIFGGWCPVPIIMDTDNGIEAPGLADGPSISRYDTTSRYMIPRHESSYSISSSNGSSRLPRFNAGLAWRQTLSWDRHRIRPKYRAHYSIPLDHIALLYSQVSWDCCRDAPKPASFLIYPIALVQDQTAALTNTVGLITNAAVLRREHACAALPDFVAAPHQGSGGGCLWKQDQKYEREFRIAEYNGRLRLELDLPVAAEGSVREALPVEEQQPPSSLSMLLARSRRGVAESLFIAEATVGTDDKHPENKLRSRSSALVDRGRQHKNKQGQPVKGGDGKLTRLKLGGLLLSQQLSSVNTPSTTSRNDNPHRSKSRGRTSTARGDRLHIGTGKDTQEYPEGIKSAAAVNKALSTIPVLAIPLLQRQGLPQPHERRALPPLPTSVAAAIAPAAAVANVKATQSTVKHSAIPVVSRSGAAPLGAHVRTSCATVATGFARARATAAGAVLSSSSPLPRPPSSAASRTATAATTAAAKISATSTSRNNKNSTPDIKTKVVVKKEEKGGEEDIGPPPTPPMRSILRRSASDRQLTRPRPPISMPPMPVTNKAYADAITNISTKNDAKTSSTTTSSSHTSTAATPLACQNSSSSASRRDRSSGKGKYTRSKSCGPPPGSSSSSRWEKQPQHRCHDNFARRAPPPPPLPGIPDSFRNGGGGCGADGETNIDELRARLTNMIDTSIMELEWLYF